MSASNDVWTKTISELESAHALLDALRVPEGPLEERIRWHTEGLTPTLDEAERRADYDQCATCGHTRGSHDKTPAGYCARCRCIEFVERQDSLPDRLTLLGVIQRLRRGLDSMELLEGAAAEARDNLLIDTARYEDELQRVEAADSEERMTDGR